MVDDPVVIPDPVVIEDPDTHKVWWKSAGIWGSIIAAGSGVIAMATGHVLTPTDQAMLTATALNLINALSTIIAIVGAVVAWWGRTHATKIISKNIISPVKPLV
jgi:uncharacterized membrane protein